MNQEVDSDASAIGIIFCGVDPATKCALWFWGSDLESGLRNDERVFADDGALCDRCGGAPVGLRQTHCAGAARSVGAALAGAVAVHCGRLCAQ